MKEMNSIVPSKPVEREDLLKMIRKMMKEKGRRVGMREFMAAHKARERDVFRNFPGWEEALRAAGCEERAKNAPVKSETLLENWGRVAEKVGRIPTQHDYLMHGSNTHRTLCDRFGSWNQIPEAFREFAESKPEWKKVMKYVTHSIQTGGRHSRRPKGRVRKRIPRLPERPVCGAQVVGGALRFAPTNELGVVLLFGKMAEQLGFFVVGLQPYFPDCMAMREIAPGNWQPVRIEFEFESRSFRIHRHKPDGCDIIVCWEHNWKECPKNIEVIELKEEIEVLGFKC